MRLKRYSCYINKEQFDEDLIAAVKSSPALYNFLLSLKER